MRGRALLPLSLPLLASTPALAATRLALEGGASDSADDTYIDVEALLEDLGYEVDIVVAADIDTLEEIEAYDAILLGDSGSGDHDWADFDSVLTEYVEGGGGIFASGWVAYFASASSEPELVELLPVTASMSYESTPSITASGSSALTDGWTSFTCPSYSNHGGGAREGASVAATTSGGQDSVVYWEVGEGRVLHHSANYLVSEGYYDHSSLYDGTDADALQSFLVSIEWVAGAPDAVDDECDASPVIAMEAAGLNASDTYPEIQALLEDLGWTVDIVTGDALDSLEELEAYDAVFIGDSGAGDHDWADFDDVLATYVDGGGGLLASGWVNYFDAVSGSSDIGDLLPVEGWTAFDTGRTVIAESGSPLATTWSEYDVTGNLDIPDTVRSGASVAAYDDEGSPAIVHWEVGDGRVVFLSANYLVSSAYYAHSALWDGTEPDAWAAFVEAGAWAAGACEEEDPVEDADGDGYSSDEDCDDTDATIYPGAREVCDGLDNDCDGDIDLDAVDAGAWYADADDDGYGDPSLMVRSCDAPEGYVASSEDCDDGDVTVSPSAAEVCDGADNDCDGSVDVGAVDAPTWYVDLDEDGYGDRRTTLAACEAPEGYVDNSGDCDDREPLAWTDAEEVCDGVDNDCVGGVDVGAVDAGTWYADLDEDGYGDPGAALAACDTPEGHVANDGDCDDAEALAWTGAVEVCDEVDNDCDGGIDLGAVDAGTWYADLDGDGYTVLDDAATACTPPDGYSAPSADEDCDDGDDTIYPGATELADDGIDQDCDGTDESSGDGGSGDGGAGDGGSGDGGSGDGGSGDGGSDGGAGDGGAGDGGAGDGGSDDGGSDDDKDDSCGGCASSATPGGLAWLLPLAGLLLARRRRGPGLTR